MVLGRLTRLQQRQRHGQIDKPPRLINFNKKKKKKTIKLFFYDLKRNTKKIYIKLILK